MVQKENGSKPVTDSLFGDVLKTESDDDRAAAEMFTEHLPGAGCSAWGPFTCCAVSSVSLRIEQLHFAHEETKP